MQVFGSHNTRNHACVVEWAVSDRSSMWLITMWQWYAIVISCDASCQIRVCMQWHVMQYMYDTYKHDQIWYNCVDTQRICSKSCVIASEERTHSQHMCDVERAHMHDIHDRAMNVWCVLGVCHTLIVMYILCIVYMYMYKQVTIHMLNCSVNVGEWTALSALMRTHACSFWCDVTHFGQRI